ncbi:MULTISPECIES: ABC transporter substrate-binding protein [unclassified Romboutsia]|uniref:ABC transporter substrate-binding protein n=1 Tax=unclassified Romboutsia TaxID=2626894 RepID=UPI0008231D5A|nr:MULTISPECIES: ABC transporter substrate-binding protein [unclassified Romboutsia]SCH86955.1 Glutathione-binding protein gsiB precursor [uncultured Clostridium sp.]
MFLLILQLTGCSVIDSSIEWEEKDQLVFGTTLSTKSLDPANGYCGWFTVRYGVGETLFKLDDNMQVEPWIAENYEMIDGKTWKIELKNNISFQNGKNLTPLSVKNSIDRTLKLNARAEETLKIDNIKVEDNSIIITTTEENPTLINDLCDPFVAIIDVEEENIDTNPIGTGPFKVSNFNPTGSSYFEKNESYWDEEVKLSSIKVIPIADADTLAMALQSGEIDVAQGLSYSMISLFEKDSNYKISSTDTSRAIVMYFNGKNEDLKNSNVRKAINMLINKDDYCNSILKSQATPSVGAFPSNTSYSLDKLDIEYDKDKSIELLNREGYTDSNNDGILDKDGKTLSFKLVTYSARAELPSIAQAIQNDLKNVGIDVNIEITDNINDILSSGNFELAIYSNITSATGDTLAYLNNAMKTNGASNYGGYSNREVDELIDKLKIEFNKEERDKLATEIQKLALDENAYNFIANMKMSFVMKNNVTGIDPHPTDYYQFNANTDIE